MRERATRRQRAILSARQTRRARRHIVFLTAASAAGLLVSSHSHGATAYFDADASATGNNLNGAGIGGTGNWDLTTKNWWDGTSTDAAWTNGNLAEFTGGPGTTTITASGIIVVGVTAFVNQTISASGGNSFQVTGNVNQGSAGKTLTINAPITGAGFINIGAGNLVLGGTNSFTSLSSTQGFLLIGTINNKSTNGTLGNLTSVTLGSSGKTATLEYTGATASSNMAFSLATSGTGAFQVDTAATNLTISGAISGSGALSKTGAGTLTLATTNVYTGATTVSGGNLILNSIGAIGGSGASVTINAGAAVALHSATDPSTFFSRIVTTSAGAIALDTSSGVDINFSTAGFTAASLGAIGNAAYTGNLTPNGTAYRLGGGGGTLTLSNTNALSGANSLVVSGSTNGSGTVALTSSNNFSGGTSISGGTLSFASGALGTTGTIAFTGSSTLQWNGTNTDDMSSRLQMNAGVNATLDTNGNNVTLANAIGNSSTAAVTKAGGGTLTLSAANTFSGAISINAGVVKFSALNSLGTGTTINFGGGTLQYASGNTVDISTRVVSIGSSGGTIDTNGNNVTFASAIGNSLTGALSKTGSGTLTLGGTNTFSGGLNVNGGQVNFSTDLNLGAAGKGVVFNNGGILSFTATSLTENRTFNFNGAGTIDIAIAGGSNGKITVNSGANQITGAGAATKTGPGWLTMLQANNNTGSWTINGGVIEAGNATALGANGTGTPSATVNVGGELAASNGPTLPNNITLAGGTIGATNNAGAFSGAISVTANSNLRLGNFWNGTSQNLALTGSLSGTGRLTVIPASGASTTTGTLIVTGGNGNFSGGFTVPSGTLIAQSNQNNGLGTGSVVLSGGNLALKGRSYASIAASGYNLDSIYATSETGEFPSATDSRLDGSYSYYQTNFTAPSGFSNAGTVLSTGGLSQTFTSAINGTPFSLQSFTANNTLQINKGSTGTLTLTAPTALKNLAILATSTNAANDTPNVTITFADNSSVTTTFKAFDWFLNGDGTRIGASALGTTGIFRYSPTNSPGWDQRPFGLYETDIDLTNIGGTDYSGRSIASLTFGAAGIGARTNIFAISGSASNLAATAVQSYANNVSVTADTNIDVSGSLNATLGNLSIGSNKLSVTSSDSSGSAYSLTFGTTTLSGDATFDVASSTGGGAGTLSLGAVSGNGGIIKSNSGTLQLTGPGTYAGTFTSINAGTILASDGGAFSGSTIFLGNGGTTTTAAALLMGNATGGLTVSNAITVNPGVNSNRTIGGTNTSGTNTIAGSIQLDSNNGSVTFAQAAGGSLAVTGNISGAGQNVTVSGPGTVILSGSDSYSGQTRIDGGTLVAGSNGALTNSSGVFVGNGANSFGNTSATLVANADGITISNSIQTNKADTGTGLGSGTRTIGGSNTSGTVTYAGNISLNGGAVLTAGNGGTVSFNGVIGDGIDTGNISHAVTISGAGGTVSLSAANLYSGDTTVSSGSLNITSTGSIVSSNITVNGGAAMSVASGGAISLTTNLTAHGSVSLNSPATTIATLNGASTGNVSLNSTNLSITTGGAFTGSISDGASAGSVTVSGGTLTLNGASSYSGGTSINGGTLLANNTTGSATGGGTVAINNGGTLGGSGTVAGTVAVNSGGAIGAGDSMHVATLSTGDQTWNTGGTFNVKIAAGNANHIGSATAGTDWDLLKFSNLSVAFDGVQQFTINVVNNFAGFDHSKPYTWVIAQATGTGTISGFDASKFVLNTSGFTTVADGDSFALSVSDGGSELDLNYVPEPSSLGLIAAGGFRLLTRRRRGVRMGGPATQIC